MRLGPSVWSWWVLYRLRSAWRAGNKPAGVPNPRDGSVGLPLDARLEPPGLPARYAGYPAAKRYEQALQHPISAVPLAIERYHDANAPWFSPFHTVRPVR